MKLKQILFLSIILVSMSSIAFSQSIPQKISFQGRLIDAQSQKPVTAEKNFTFKMGDWIEAHTNVQVNNGLYSVILGSANPIPLTLFNDWQANLKILVDGKEMAPDIDLVSAPYAFKAAQVGNLFFDDGKIGIETQNPQAMIDIAGRIASGMAGEKHKIRFTYAGTGLFGFRVGDGNRTLNIDRFDYSANWQSALTISRPHAFVGINNENPAYTLDVSGNIRLSTQDNHHCGFILERNDEDGRNHLWKIWHMDEQFGQNSLQIWEYKNDSNGKICGGDTLDGAMCNSRFTIREGGNIGIGTRNPEYTLHVNGTAFCTDASWTASDERYKQNIQPLKNSLQKITQLKGVNYAWKTDEYPEKNFSKDKQVGMIAQDVEKIIPEIVHTDDEGYKSISYDKMAAYFVEALKELKKENENLKRQLEIQKQQINRLTNSIY